MNQIIYINIIHLSLPLHPARDLYFFGAIVISG